MSGVLRVLCCWLLLVSTSSALAAGHTGAPTAAEVQAARLAIVAGEKGDWGKALGIAESHPMVSKAMFWLSFQDERWRPDFDTVTQFITRNPTWPLLPLLRRVAEESLDGTQTEDRVLAWFTANPPVSQVGRLALIEILLRRGRPQDATPWIRQSWVAMDYDPRGEQAFLERYGSLLTPEDHARRLDRLLWDGRIDDARRMLARVEHDQRLVAEARLVLMGKAKGPVEARLKQVPIKLQDDPGVAFERLRLLRQEGQDDAARELILARGAHRLGRPEKWWPHREILARQAFRMGYISEAYRLARDHGLPPGPERAEAEWLAGWIALRFLDEAATALPHFESMYEAVKFPVSKARAAYWAGRAAEQAKLPEAMRRWYGEAARHPAVFYGQLAAQRIGRPELQLPPVKPDAKEVAAVEAGELTHMARLFAAVDRPVRVKHFIVRMAELAETPAQHAAITRLASDLGRPDLAVRAAKYAARQGVVLPLGYPTISFPQNGGPEVALLHALSRQESEFNTEAVSPAGARGLMQLMPATAKHVAKNLGISYKLNRLTDDPKYNMTLGSAYLDDLLRKYDGSYVMALAGYNAGPGRVVRWMAENGDPRLPEVDVVDWVESIPFQETRNYVQRVLENVQVYRARLNGHAVKLNLAQDLKRPTGMAIACAAASTTC